MDISKEAESLDDFIGILLLQIVKQPPGHPLNDLAVTLGRWRRHTKALMRDLPQSDKLRIIRELRDESAHIMRKGEFRTFGSAAFGEGTARSIYTREIDDLIESHVTVPDALGWFIQLLEYCEDRLKKGYPPQKLEDPDRSKFAGRGEGRIRLADITKPQESAGPVHFMLVGDRLAVKHHHIDDLPAKDRANVIAAREALLEQGERLAAAVEFTNLDERIKHALQALSEKILTAEDIVQVGLMVQTLEFMARVAASEVSATVYAMLQGYIMGVRQYLGQFPEWFRFIENAAATELEPSDGPVLVEHVEAIAADLEKKPDMVDPEVPAVLRYLIDLVKNPIKTSKRTLYALLSTLQNLASWAFKIVAAGVDETAKKTSTAVATAIAASVAGVLTVHLTGLELTLAKVSEASWLIEATAWVRWILAL